MSWSSPTANLTFATGEIVTAAKMNLIRDDLNDLDRRTATTLATVAASENTTSTTFVNLTTTGPAVTVTIGSTGLCQVALHALLTNSTDQSSTAMSYAVSGASTIAAADSRSIAMAASGAGNGNRFGATLQPTGLAAGSTTFTAKYRVSANTGSAADRSIVVTPLGS